MSGNTLNKIEQAGSIFKPEVKTEPALENAQEKVAEKSVLEKKAEKEGATALEVKESASFSTAAATADDYHKRREIQIDACLSEGLNETFLAMTPDKQKIFKAEGEKTVKKINILLDATKVNISKIIKLIKHWLGLITGINRFFLDQEAKIKADKIVKIKNKL